MFIKFDNFIIYDDDFTQEIDWDYLEVEDSKYFYNLFESFYNAYVQHNRNPIPNLILLIKKFNSIPGSSIGSNMFYKNILIIFLSSKNIDKQEYEKYMVLT